MPCSQTLAGLASSCGINLGGGIAKMYIANRGDVTETVTSNVVSALTEGVFYEYNVKKESTTLTSTWTIDGAVKFCQTDVAASIAQLSTTARVELEALLQADVYVVIGDNNGKYWAIGSGVDGAQLSALSGTTGTAKSDANQFELTITSYDSHFPYEVDAAIIDTLVA